jgi:lipooligosaccharide transport system ATP-binding protein
MSFAVEARDLVKRYDSLVAVDRVDFTVNFGEAFGLLGPNGAGKSTIMKMIHCRIAPTEGELRVSGLDVKSSKRQIKGRVGVVQQENSLDPDLSVLENLLVFARYFRIPRSTAEIRAVELIRLLDLEEKRNANIETLSGGMKRRLMIARALINEPSLLVLDEPTTGLDPQVRHAIWDQLRTLKSKGITIVLSTHYMDEAEKLCDRILIIDHGRILVKGSPRELISRYALDFALEARGCDGRPLQSHGSGIVSESRGSTHFYFASTAEQLAPLLRAYEQIETHLRPSNLEDVFLRLTGTDERFS